MPATEVVPLLKVIGSMTEVPAWPMTLPPDNVGDDTAGGGGGILTVNARVAVPVPPLFVALKVMLEVPAVVGVPEIKPVTVLTDRPAGNPMALYEVGLLVAVI